jgi:hypothetical protein
MEETLSTEEEEEISIQLVEREEGKPAVIVEIRLIDSERSPQKLIKAQYQEQKDKARAWGLDQKRERHEKK